MSLLLPLLIGHCIDCPVTIMEIPIIGIPTSFLVTKSSRILRGDSFLCIHPLDPWVTFRLKGSSPVPSVTCSRQCASICIPNGGTNFILQVAATNLGDQLAGLMHLSLSPSSACQRLKLACIPFPALFVLRSRNEYLVN